MCQIFSGFNLPNIIIIGYFLTVIQKLKGGRFGAQCTLVTLLAQTLPFGNVTSKEKKQKTSKKTIKTSNVFSPAASVVQKPDPPYSVQSKWPAANNLAGHSRANE